MENCNPRKYFNLVYDNHILHYFDSEKETFHSDTFNLPDNDLTKTPDIYTDMAEQDLRDIIASPHELATKILLKSNTEGSGIIFRAKGNGAKIKFVRFMTYLD